MILIRFIIASLFACLGLAWFARSICQGQATESVKSPFSTVSKRETLSIDPSRDELVVGRALQGEWAAVIERSDTKHQIIWDSKKLHDPFFDVKAPDWIKSLSHGPDYKVIMRGCVPHQCTDGRIGIAIFSGRTNRLYVEHLITQNDGDYTLQFRPDELPPEIRADLERAACTDPGITAPSRLPFPCG